MKHGKKILSLALALVLALALSVPALAANGTNSNGGSITIDNAVVGQTYTVYQILTLESYDTDASAYSYKATDAWSTFVNGSGIKGTYLNVDAQGYVTWVEGASAAEFAEKAQTFAKTLTSNQGQEKATTTTVAFTGLNLGYYLVDSTLGTLCSLDTTNPSVTMKEKSEAPTNVKQVQEDSRADVDGNGWDIRDDADLGQTVNFKSTITAKPGAEGYVLHDTMSAGLTFTAVTGVTLDGVAVAAENYTVTSTGLTDGCTFEVAFTQAFLDGLSFSETVKTHEIVVSYSAVVNEDAVIAGIGNSNQSYLSYGDTSSTSQSQTPPSTTTTYTWELKVFKHNANEDGLADAVFTLSKNADGTNPIALISKGSNVYRVAKVGESGAVTSITTDDTGAFKIEGLDSDTYYLTETTAPAGFNILAGPVKIEIDETAGAVTYWTYNPTPTVAGVHYEGDGISGDATYGVKVLNQTGAELPETGGAGTTMIYVIGAALALGALVLLVTRRRMNRHG